MDEHLSIALQELALEGIQGCTVQKLWMLLQAAGIAAEVIGNGRFKQLLWQQLLLVPGVLLFRSDSIVASTSDPSVQPVDEAEKLELRFVAPESLRESALGISDLKVCDARLSRDQRSVLECIAKSRSKGIPQSQLGKEFKIPGNKMFYLVKMLEVRGLVVRQATLVRTVDGNLEGKTHVPIVATNLLHLTRFAKDLTLSSHQRFEIFSAPGDINQNDSNVVCENSDENGKDSSAKQREFVIKDDLPAIQAVCQKLEETDGKVLVVSDLKSSLGYRMAVGHRTWRRLMKRLQDAGLVEIFNAKIEQKVRACIRLVKSFDARAFKTSNDEAESELPLKCAKRGKITDLVTELPIDDQIYNLVDRSGVAGIQMMEVFNSLGLQNKRNYYRISAMLEKRLLVSESESHKRSTLYRLRTARNIAGASQSAVSDSFKESRVVVSEDDLPSNSGLHEESEEIALPEASNLIESSVPHKGRGRARKALQQARTLRGRANVSELMHDKTGNARERPTEVEMKQEPSWLNPDILALQNPGNDSIQPEGSPSLSIVSCAIKDTENPSTSSTTMSTTRAQREKRIMEKLQAENFVLRVELHRWLEEVENRKNIMMDRKTLARMLQSLQASGHCKCVMLSMPGLTNCGRQRKIDVVLLPSVVVDQELLSKVHDKVRRFDTQSRSHGRSRVKAKVSLPVLTDVPRMHTAHEKRIIKFDQQNESFPTMQANGFIPAKMVRVRMLHYFLWGYVNGLADDTGLLHDGSGTSGEMVGSCKTFGLANAVQAMPLEQFLQTVGSLHKMEKVTAWCKQKVCLCELPKEDKLALLESNAVGRLSWLVDVLQRLKLVRLVMGCGPSAQLDHEGFGKSSISAVLTYAMEREPYLEEPAPPPLPPLNPDTYDISPRARHEFRIVNKGGLDTYWQSLEYFYSGAQPSIARHSFPGSNVPELFGLRSWATQKIMSFEQRTELLKRVGEGGIEKRKPWHECVVIAKDLNLSLQQVLRVSYDKNRVYRLQTLQKAGRIPKKRTGSPGDLSEPPHVRAYKKQKRDNEVGKEAPSESLNRDVAAIVDGKQVGPDENDVDDDEDNEGFGVGGLPMNDFSFVASAKPSRPRSRRFMWSEELDRILIVAYAKQRAQVGALYHRTDWDMIAGLPAPPRASQRRMAQIRLDPGVRKAVTNLCSLLSLRYLNRNHSQANESMSEELHLRRISSHSPLGLVAGYGNHMTSSIERSREGSCDGQSEGHQLLDHGQTITHFAAEYDWNDMREPFVAAALDEVMRCMTVTRANAGNRGNGLRSKLSKGAQSGLLQCVSAVNSFAGGMQGGSAGVIEDRRPKNLEAGAAAGASFVKDPALLRLSSSAVGHSSQDSASRDEEGNPQASSPMPGRSLASAGPTRRVRKHIPSVLRRSVRSQEETSEQLVRRSLAVANAVELVKLVLLNSGGEAQLSGPLVDAIQRFKENEILTAVKYLRERGFLVAGQAGQTFVLSAKYFHDSSASRFPPETSHECVLAEQWFSEHMKEIEQDWVHLPSEPQSGQLAHVLACVSTHEFLLNPSLPANDDLGEMEKEPGKRKSSAHRPRPNVRNVKARTSPPMIPIGSAIRRERGFPGIEVSLTLSKRLSVGISKSRLEAAVGQPLAAIRDLERTRNASDFSGLHRVLLHRPDSYQVERSDEEALIETGSDFSQLNPSPDTTFCGQDWETNCRKEHSLSITEDPSAIFTSPIKSVALNECIQHCLSKASDGSRGNLLHFDPDRLQAAYVAVGRAGEEGLQLETLTEHLKSSGMDAKVESKEILGYVQALESFGLVKMVNAYDHSQIVETSQCERLYLHISGQDDNAGEKFGNGEGVRDHGRRLIRYGQGLTLDAGSNRPTDRGKMPMSDSRFSGNFSEPASRLLTGISSTTSSDAEKGGDHRVIPLWPNSDRHKEHVAIVPWLSQNGTVNKHILKGLTRRMMGIVALHPGISEDTLLEQMNVLNPQSARLLVHSLESDGHLYVRSFPCFLSVSPPRLLQNLVTGQNCHGSMSWMKHYFVNTLSGQHL